MESRPMGAVMDGPTTYGVAEDRLPIGFCVIVRVAVSKIPDAVASGRRFLEALSLRVSFCMVSVVRALRPITLLEADNLEPSDLAQMPCEGASSSAAPDDQNICYVLCRHVAFLQHAPIETADGVSVTVYESFRPPARRLNIVARSASSLFTVQKSILRV